MIFKFTTFTFTLNFSTQFPIGPRNVSNILMELNVMILELSLTLASRPAYGWHMLRYQSPAGTSRPYGPDKGPAGLTCKFCDASTHRHSLYNTWMVLLLNGYS